MPNKNIITSLIFFCLISFTYLAYIEQQQADPDYQKNWWVIYFSEPKSGNLNFNIENHGDRNDFTWQVISGKDVFKNGKAKIDKGANQKISIDAPISISGRIKVQVITGDDEKEIFKILP